MVREKLMGDRSKFDTDYTVQVGECQNTTARNKDLLTKGHGEW